MNIYLIRHGDAEKASLSIRDSERKLTHEGEIKLKAAAEGWKNFIKGFDYIVSSPLVRAMQTAKIVSDVFAYPGKIITENKIKSGGRTDDLIEIANILNAENVAFIGHEPDFSEHVSALISSSGARIAFKKGTIAKISFHNKAKISRGELEFLIPINTFK